MIYKILAFILILSVLFIPIIDIINDDAFFKLGNYFKTKEEAEKVKEELDKFWAKVRAGEIGGNE